MSRYLVIDTDSEDVTIVEAEHSAAAMEAYMAMNVPEPRVGTTIDVVKYDLAEAFEVKLSWEEI